MRRELFKLCDFGAAYIIDFRVYIYINLYACKILFVLRQSFGRKHHRFTAGDRHQCNSATPVEIHEYFLPKTMYKGAAAQEMDNNVGAVNNRVHWCQVVERFVATFK